MAAVGFSGPVARLPGRSKALQSSCRAPCCLNWRLATVGRNDRRAAASKEASRFPGKNKALKTEPHERYRDETSPEGDCGVQAVESVRNAEDGR